MKVCFTSNGKELSSELDSRFGRCKYLIFIDTKNENNKVKIVENPNTSAPSGAGVQTANLVISESVDILVTGNIGPNAHNIIKNAGIKIISSEGGTIKELLKKLEKGELKEIDSPTTDKKSGLN